MAIKEDLRQALKVLHKYTERADEVASALHYPIGTVRWDLVLDEMESDEITEIPYSWTERHCGWEDERFAFIPMRYILAPEDEWRKMVEEDRAREARERAERMARAEARERAEAQERAQYERLRAKYG